MREDVRRLVFGTAALGLPYGLGRCGAQPSLMSEADASALVERALDTGITTFDTAPAYGLSEERLGRALAGRGRVWTKTGRHEVLGQGLADELRRSLDDSLSRLNRAQVELLQWHNWKASLLRESSFLAAWRAIREDGRALSLGASTYGAEDAKAAVNSGMFDVVQVEWNLLNQGVVASIGPVAKSKGVAVAVRSVLLQGALTDEQRTLPELPSLRRGVERARALARELGMPLQQLAIRAALDHPSVAFVLLGIDRREQLDEARLVASHPALAVTGPLEEVDLRGDSAADPRSWNR